MCECVRECDLGISLFRNKILGCKNSPNQLFYLNTFALLFFLKICMIIIFFRTHPLIEITSFVEGSQQMGPLLYGEKVCPLHSYYLEIEHCKFDL